MPSVLGGLGPTIIAVMWIEQLLATGFVGLRLFCRTSLTAKSARAGADDILMVSTIFLLLGYTVCCTVAANDGFGQRAIYLTKDQFIEANKVEIIGQTFCIIGIATSKCAVGAFQIRIYKAQWQKLLLWVTMVSVSGICFVVALFDFVRCSPVEAVWNPFLLPNAVCFVNTESFTALSVALSVICVVVDFLYAILPWIALWNLQMPKNTKIIICGAMSLGVFAGICGIVRAINLLGLSARSDYSYETVGLILWSSTELLVTIMTGCIPCYRELWVRLFGRRSSEYQKHGDQYRLEKTPKGGSRNGFSSQPGGVETQIYFGERDDSSDRGILHGNSMRDGVKVTSDVTVETSSDTLSVGHSELAHR